MGIVSTWKLGKAAVAAAVVVGKVTAFIAAKGLPALEILWAALRRILELQAEFKDRPGAEKLLALVAWFRRTWPQLADNTRIDELLEMLATTVVDLLKAINVFRGKGASA